MRAQQQKNIWAFVDWNSMLNIFFCAASASEKLKFDKNFALFQRLRNDIVVQTEDDFALKDNFPRNFSRVLASASFYCVLRTRVFLPSFLVWQNKEEPNENHHETSSSLWT